MYNQPPQGPQQSPPGKGMAIASMVLGIVSLCLPYGGIVTAIVGLALGAIANQKLSSVGAPKGMAVAGIVMCIISLAFAIICITACAACLPWEMI